MGPDPRMLDRARNCKTTNHDASVVIWKTSDIQQNKNTFEQWVGAALEHHLAIL
jgi:hypothetical protein